MKASPNPRRTVWADRAEEPSLCRWHLDSNLVCWQVPALVENRIWAYLGKIGFMLLRFPKVGITTQAGSDSTFMLLASSCNIFGPMAPAQSRQCLPQAGGG